MYLYLLINDCNTYSRLYSFSFSLFGGDDNNSALIGELYSQYKDEDGFIYIMYSGENTFGELTQDVIHDESTACASSFWPARRKQQTNIVNTFT